VNSLFVLLEIASWKPVVSALLLPPVPFLVLMLLGARLMLPRRGRGWFVVVLSVAGRWLSLCTGVGRAAEHYLVDPPAALSTERIRQLKADAKAGGSNAIVVLGGGVEPLAPEYGMSNLGSYSLERLRYAMWLARETGLPVGFSGGVGWEQSHDVAEADVAARIAAQDYKLPLKWTENQSRDTRENAARMLPLLKASGVRHVVLVTHGWHMPRSRRAFDEAGRRLGITVEPAPIGLSGRTTGSVFDWIPSAVGYARVRNAVREWLGMLVGA
jgi:uncharacterized SAM-binding protein YcdF (DUF218 family)